MDYPDCPTSGILAQGGHILARFLRQDYSFDMDISISQKHLDHIRRKVDSGAYPSADAVVARALALLEERDLADSDPAVAKELASIRAKVMKGVKDLEEGRFTEYANVDDIFEDVKRRARERQERRERRASGNGPTIS